MNYSFEYIDIILLAMIAGFIFLRLKFLGRTGYEKTTLHLKNFEKSEIKKSKYKNIFDENAKKNF